MCVCGNSVLEVVPEVVASFFLADVMEGVTIIE